MCYDSRGQKFETSGICNKTDDTSSGRSMTLCFFDFTAHDAAALMSSQKDRY